MTVLETLIQEHNLRLAWPNEASDFTPWLDNEDEVEYLVECKDLDMVFIALGVGGTTTDLNGFHNYINHYFNKRIFKKP